MATVDELTGMIIDLQNRVCNLEEELAATKRDTIFMAMSIIADAVKRDMTVAERVYMIGAGGVVYNLKYAEFKKMAAEELATYGKNPES